MQQECRTSRILFFHYFPPFQFVPLLRLLVLSSHYFFITTRFLRCWCLASWSLDPVLFLPLVISFLSVLVFEKKVTNTRSFLFGELDHLFPSRQLHLHAAMQEQCGDGGGHWSEPAWEVRLNGFCSHVDTEYIAALLRRAGKTRRLNSAVNFPGSVHPRHIRHLKKKGGVLSFVDETIAVCFLQQYCQMCSTAVVHICITGSALALGIYCCLVESVRSLLLFDLYGNQQ